MSYKKRNMCNGFEIKYVEEKLVLLQFNAWEYVIFPRGSGQTHYKFYPLLKINRGLCLQGIEIYCA